MSFVRKVLPVAALTVLAFGSFAAPADDAAEKARKKLEKKEIRFRAKEFIEAVENGEMDVIDLFLTAGMDVNGKGSYGNTALHVAASNENAKVMARLLKAKPDVNALNDEKRTPLYEAVHSGQLSRGKNTLPLLLAAGADMKIRYRYGQTIVHEAVDNDNPDALQILIKAGAEVDAKDEHGKTPLFEAAGLRPKLVPILTAAGANPNAREGGPQGETALMSAANVGEAESVKALLKAGADAKATDAQATTALHYAARMNRASMQSLKIPDAQYVETIKALVGAGTPVDAKTKGSGETALLMAAKEGHVEMSKALIAAGANVNAKDGYEQSTALMFAAKDGNADLAKLLVDAKADVNARDRNGKTALKFAEDYPEVAALLKAGGAKEGGAAAPGKGTGSSPSKPKATTKKKG